MLKLTAEYADEWNGVQITTEVAKTKNEFLDSCCERSGRDPASIVRSLHIHVFISWDKKEVDRNVEIFRGGLTADNFKNINLMGTPEELVGRIEEYKEAGIDRLQLLFLDTPSVDSLELFGEEVISQF